MLNPQGLARLRFCEIFRHPQKISHNGATCDVALWVDKRCQAKRPEGRIPRPQNSTLRVQS